MIEKSAKRVCRALSRERRPLRGARPENLQSAGAESARLRRESGVAERRRRSVWRRERQRERAVHLHKDVHHDPSGLSNWTRALVSPLRSFPLVPFPGANSIPARRRGGSRAVFRQPGSPHQARDTVFPPATGNWDSFIFLPAGEKNVSRARAIIPLDSPWPASVRRVLF